MSAEKLHLPTFLESGFDRLNREVISAGRCTSCGLCVAFCPKIEFKGDTPEFVEDYDTVCGLCYTFCPRTFLPVSEIEKSVFGKVREDEILGVYRDYISAKTTRSDILERAQDGGVVTSLLAYALEEGIIDGVVVTVADKDWKVTPIVVTSYEDLLKTAGTKYTKSANILGVKEAIESGLTKIGVCGTPCHIQAVRKLQTLEEPYGIGKENIALSIGLFCMESFGYNLIDFVGKKIKDIKEIDKFDIKKGELLVYSKNEIKKIPLKEISQYAMPGCSTCKDFTAELADISVGSVGSPGGWSTVFVRSEIGEKVFKGAKDCGYIKSGTIDNLDPIKKLSARKSSEY
ncbi:MAG: Coenzyme F420 hydrogenase/dehydrogenase, beta subunit C-terminal domain [Halobacteriota archaeon]|nr:Coenzyme F420 hydrogenase/dehydrogenase, beta subunit C-terminal domain [Halobacteriota archaeon]